MRILHITKRFWPYVGGVERYVEDVAAAQARNGAAVRVLTPDRDLVAGAPARLRPFESYRGIDIWRVPAIGNQRKQVARGRFRGILTLYRWADVVHHHDPRFLFETSVVMRRLVGSPLVFHTHGLILHTDAYAGAKRLLMRWYYGPVLANLVDIVIADSMGDRALLRDTTGRDLTNVRLVTNAVELGEFMRIADETQRDTILTWGRIDRHKGIMCLLDAFAAMPGAVRLTVAGSGPAPLLSELQARAAKLDIAARVTWAGRVSDEVLHVLLSQAAVVAFPSEFEGFGLALVEAMAAGRPVVASDIPTHREILGPTHAYWLADFGSEQGAALIVEALALSPEARRDLGESLRLRASKFDLGRLVRDIDEIYSDLNVFPR